MNITAVNNSHCCIWNSPICAPLRFLIQKVYELATAVFGYILRIVTFQLGMQNVTGAYWIMRIYQKLCSYDPRDQKPFDRARLDRSTEFLISCGGRPEEVYGADGGSVVQLMSYKPEDFFEYFREQGSTPIPVIFEGRARRALIDPPEEDAAKFSLPLLDITMPDGTARRGALLPDQCQSEHPPHIFYFHSPGQSMNMPRGIIGKFVLAGYEATFFDYRGTVDSTGVPSEGGYYRDAEAVLEYILRQGVPANRIYALGFCKGAGVATHIKKLYHHQGLHLVAANPYTSIKEVFEGYGWLGKLAAYFGIDALKDPNIDVPQDYFNNVEKLKNLPQSEGKLIIIHTDTDTMMPRGTASKMIEAFDNAGPVHELLRIHPNPNVNGHLQPPYEDDLIWRRLVHIIV